MRKMKDSGIEWIGEIPEDWNIDRIGSHFSEIKEKNTNNLYQNALQFKMGNIISKPKKWEMDEISDIYSAYTIVHKGDIMINGLNLEFDFITQRVAMVREKGIITSAYIALKPNHTVHSEYICYLFKSYDYMKAFHNMGKGLRKILNYSELKVKPIILPSLFEQQKISAFLDRKCTEIDSVISKTKATIEEYKKLKQSVITQAVTKGIIPNRPMKDSGIEWIGEIPQEWEVIKMKYLGKCRNGLTYSPDNLTDENNGTLVLRSSNIKDGKLVFTDNVYVNMNIRKELLVQSGDILICSRNGSRKLIGKNAIIPSNLKASFGAFMMIFQCQTPEYVKFILDSEIFSYYLGTFLTATINQLTTENFNNMQIVYCRNENEQQEIVNYLDEKCSEIDKLIAKKEQLLTEMENYKKSVIYEYVTGKKEVE